MNKVFLGGTCNETTWRETISKVLYKENISFFNPVVEDWTPECQIIETYQKEKECNIHLYIITAEMTGVFSIAEVIESAHRKDKITILQVIPDNFQTGQLRSLEATIAMVKEHGGFACMNRDIFQASTLICTLYKWR